MTPQALQHAITSRTKVLILNTPHNPTSAMYLEKDLRALVPVIRESGIFVIVDELYENLIFDGRKHFSLGSIEEIADQVITVNGLSKAFAMTGWRLGYATAPKDIMEAMNRLQSQAVSHPSSISQMAAIEALSGSQDSIEAMRTAFQKRRDLVVKLLSDIPGIIYSTPQAAFYVFIDLSNFLGAKLLNGSVVYSADDIADSLLEDHGLALVSGSGFGMPDAIRLSFAASEDAIQEGIARLKKGLATIK